MLNERPQPALLNNSRVAQAVSFLVALFASASLFAADLDECRKQFISGKYQQCIAATATAIRERSYGEGWPDLKARAELAIGRYSDAKATVDAGLKRYRWSVQLRLAGHRACLETGEPKRAANMLKEINDMAGRFAWRYTAVEDLIALGKAALLMKADAREVLETFFDRAKKYNPKRREPYLAIGQLALDKNDSALAADIFRKALKQFPDDPDVHFGLAQALAGSDPQRSAVALAKALELNPNHVRSLLAKVDGFIDSERYGEAEQWLQRVLAINPKQGEAWAYQAALAHLDNDPKGETLCRAMALGSWSQNPAVDHLIGKKLSQKYRFAEGAACQRRALNFDKTYLPARIQLSQDLLRLGEEQEGWELANQVYESDGYDVVTFNLVELRDRIAKFRTLEDDDFIVRMDAREAAIYGPDVLKLLHRAKQTLTKKYGLDLKRKVTVEIFPDQNDFAVRTFGMPAVSGFLGVCFGKVITANSPASQHENPSNWQAVLWHEFCHVVTLELTHNRIPRWLSEGISVYEELQANRTWGQRMNPRYRQMVLGGELTPIGQLSGAFLSPKTPLHLQFAYYESALAVEFLVKRYGPNALKRVLHDLGAGLPVNTALERHTGQIKKLEFEFEQFARKRAEQLAPAVDWTRHDLAGVLNDDGNAFSQWLKTHPNNFVGLSLYADKLLDDREWEQAKGPLKKLIELYPEYTGADNAYKKLAGAYQELNETKKERDILTEYATLDSDAVAAYLRLLELELADEDWTAVTQTAERLLAVNPLIAQPHRALAVAADKTGKTDTAINAYRALLAMDPDDPAEVHYRLARLLHQKGDSAAKRHVLSALEEAPRYRAAHRLLLQITRAKRKVKSSTAKASRPAGNTDRSPP